jgi:hypothetical protein
MKKCFHSEPSARPEFPQLFEKIKAIKKGVGEEEEEQNSDDKSTSDTEDENYSNEEIKPATPARSTDLGYDSNEPYNSGDNSYYKQTPNP